MTETIRFDGISLPVSDVERSVAFYQQFGFELQIRHDNFALLRLGEGTIGPWKLWWRSYLLTRPDPLC